jgi:hypothetical protein
MALHIYWLSHVVGGGGGALGIGMAQLVGCSDGAAGRVGFSTGAKRSNWLLAQPSTYYLIGIGGSVSGRRSGPRWILGRCKTFGLALGTAFYILFNRNRWIILRRRGGGMRLADGSPTRSTEVDS